MKRLEFGLFEFGHAIGLVPTAVSRHKKREEEWLKKRALIDQTKDQKRKLLTELCTSPYQEEKEDENLEVFKQLCKTVSLTKKDIQHLNTLATRHGHKKIGEFLAGFTFRITDPKAQASVVDQIAAICMKPYDEKTEKNSIEIIKDLLQKHPDLSHLDFRKYQANMYELAAKNGHIGIVRYFLEEYNVHPDTESWTKVNGIKLYNTMLHYAASFGHTEIVELLFSHGAYPNPQNFNGDTPLHLASSKGNAGMALLLLNNGANPDIPNSDGDTPLHLAVRKGNLYMSILLLMRGANPDIENAKGKTVQEVYLEHHTVPDSGELRDLHFLLLDQHFLKSRLHRVASYGCKRAVEIFLELGADPTALEQGDNNVQGKKASELVDGDIKDLLLKAEKEWEARHPSPEQHRQKEMELLKACEEGDISTVQTILDQHPISRNAQNTLGQGLLHIAAQNGHLELTRLLIEKYHFILTIEDFSGKIPSELVEDGQDDLRQLLIDAEFHRCPSSYMKSLAAILRKGAKIDFTENGWTKLGEAITCGNYKLAAFLVENGANVNLPFGKYFTPIGVAVRNGNFEITKLLLDNGANPTLPNDKKLIDQVQEGNDKLRALILEAEKNWEKELKETLLASCAVGKVEKVKSIINDNHHMVSACNESGQGLLHIAAQNGQYEVVKLLVEYELSDVTEPDENGNLPSALVPTDHERLRKLLLSEELHTYCFKNELDRVEGVIARGADVNYLINDYSELSRAVNDLNTDLVKCLIRNNANVNPIMKPGYHSPIESAVWHGHLEISRLLLENGAIPVTSAENKALSDLVSEENTELKTLVVAAEERYKKSKEPLVSVEPPSDENVPKTKVEPKQEPKLKTKPNLKKTLGIGLGSGTFTAALSIGAIIYLMKETELLDDETIAFWSILGAGALTILISVTSSLIASRCCVDNPQLSQDQLLAKS